VQAQPYVATESNASSSKANKSMIFFPRIYHAHQTELRWNHETSTFDGAAEIGGEMAVNKRKLNKRT
jgi:hypothetical protein